MEALVSKPTRSSGARTSSPWHDQYGDAEPLTLEELDALSHDWSTDTVKRPYTRLLAMAYRSATLSTGDAQDAARFRWMLPHLRVDWCGAYGEIGIVDGLPDIELETDDVREAIDAARAVPDRETPK